MEDTHSSSVEQEDLEESSSSQTQDNDEVTLDEVSEGAVMKSLGRLTSLPSPPVSPCYKNRLRRSLSYPPTCSHVCQVCAGLCICPHCPKAEEEGEGSRCGQGCGAGRETRRRRQSGGSMRTCHKHKLASMRDSVPGSLESLQDADLLLMDTEPSISATAPSGVLFQRSEQEFTECQVCLLETFSRSRLCCQMPVCDTCLQRYIREKVSRQVLSIRCPNPACCDCICKEEIQHHLSKELHQKFLQFLIEDNLDPHQKTCPHCNHIANLNQDVLFSKHKTGPDDQKVACVCGLLWCFRCHAPWHENISCKQYQRGDRLLKAWAKEQQYGQPNANRCPKCKVYIQRSSGCDNMTCSQCRTSFCYRCGERFYRIKFFGNHYSRYSVFGCKYRLLPQKPVKRKLIRGTIFGCKVAVTPIFVPLALGVGCILVVTMAPAYATFLALREYGNRKCERRRLRMDRMQRRYMAYDRTLYDGHDREEVLSPRPATLVDLPPSSWQLQSEGHPKTWTEV